MVRLENIRAIPVKALQVLANNSAIAQHLKDGFPFPYTTDHAKDFLKLANRGLMGYSFGIFADENFIGVGSILPQKDIYRKNGEIGYWIGEPYWGKGYGSKAVELLTSFAFDDLHLIRVFAGVFENNKASMKVLEHAGYALEAIHKSSIVKYGIVLDEYIYSKTHIANIRYLKAF
jgi:[ribosomal protein S5]-alanine N-acetyltransferase